MINLYGLSILLCIFSITRTIILRNASLSLQRTQFLPNEAMKSIGWTNSKLNNIPKMV